MSSAKATLSASTRHRNNTASGREKAVGRLLPDTTPLLLNPPPNAPITSFGVSPLDGAVITTHSNGVRFYKLSSSTRVRSVPRSSPQQATMVPDSGTPHVEKATATSSWAFASAYLPSAGSALGKAASKISDSSATWRSTLSLTTSPTPTASPEPDHSGSNVHKEESGYVGGEEDPTLGGIAYVQYRYRDDMALQGSYLVVAMDPALASPSLQDQHCHPKLVPDATYSFSTYDERKGGMLCTNPSLLRHVAVASCSSDQRSSDTLPSNDSEGGGSSAGTHYNHSVSILTSSETSNLCITHSLHGESKVSALTTSAVNFRRLNGAPDSILVVSGDQRGRIVLCDTQAHFIVSHGRDVRKSSGISNHLNHDGANPPTSLSASCIVSITVGGLRREDRTMPIVVCTVEPSSASTTNETGPSTSSSVVPPHPIYAVEIMVHRVHIPPAGVNAISLVNSTMIAIDSLKMPPLRNRLLLSSTTSMTLSFMPTRDCNSQDGGGGGVILAPRSKGRLLAIDAWDGVAVSTEIIPSSPPHRQQVLLNSLAAEWDWATQIISLGSCATSPNLQEGSSSMMAAITTGGQVVLLRISSNSNNTRQPLAEGLQCTSISISSPSAPTEEVPIRPGAPPTASVEEYEARDQAALEAFLGSDDDSDPSTPYTSDSDSDTTSNHHKRREVQLLKSSQKSTTALPISLRNTAAVKATPMKMAIVKRSSGLSDCTNTSGTSTPRLQQAAVASTIPTSPTALKSSNNHEIHRVYFVEEVSTLYDPKAHTSPSDPTSFEEAIPSSIYYEPYMRSVLLYFAASQHLMRVDLPTASSESVVGGTNKLKSSIYAASSEVGVGATIKNKPTNYITKHTETDAVQPKAAAPSVASAKSDMKGTEQKQQDSDEPTSLLRSVVGFGISSWGLAAGYVNKTTTTTNPNTRELPSHLEKTMDERPTQQPALQPSSPSLDNRANTLVHDLDGLEGKPPVLEEDHHPNSTVVTLQSGVAVSQQQSSITTYFDQTASVPQRSKKIVKVIVKKKRVKASSITVQSPPPKRGSTAIKPTSVQIQLEEHNRRQITTSTLPREEDTQIESATRDGEFNLSQLLFSRSSPVHEDGESHHHHIAEDETLFTALRGKRVLELDQEPAGRDVIQTTFFREWRERYAAFEQELEAIIIVKRILQQPDLSGGRDADTILQGNTLSPTNEHNNTGDTTTSRRPPPSSKSKQQQLSSVSSPELPIYEKKAILESQIGTCVEPRYVCDNIPLMNNMSYGFLFEYRRVLDRNALEEQQQQLLQSTSKKQRYDDMNDCCCDGDNDADVGGNSEDDYLLDSILLGDEQDGGIYQDPSLNIKLSAANLKDPTYLSHIRELQDRDRIAYEMSEIEHRFKDRLAKVVEVETVEIEENSRLIMPVNRKGGGGHRRVPVKKQWAPHSNIRFQHLDGSRVDWASINATFPQSVVEMKTSSNNPVSSTSSGGGSSAGGGGGQSYTASIMSSRQGPPSSCYLREGSSARESRSRGGSVSSTTQQQNPSTDMTCMPSHTETSDTVEHALWSVGTWRYAKVFPPHDPAPESYWCSYEEAIEAAKRHQQQQAAPHHSGAAQSTSAASSEQPPHQHKDPQGISSKLLSSATGLFSTWSFGRGKSKSPEPSDPTSCAISNYTATPTVSMTPTNSSTTSFPYAVRRRTLTRTRVRCLDDKKRKQLEAERDDALQEARRRLGLY